MYIYTVYIETHVSTCAVAFLHYINGHPLRLPSTQFDGYPYPWIFCNNRFFVGMTNFRYMRKPSAADLYETLFTQTTFLFLGIQ